MYESKRHATEILITEVASISPAKLSSGNNSGEITNTQLLYDLVREAKKAAKKKRGIFSDNELTNIIKAIETTQEKDLSARSEARITSKKLPGIVRRLDLYPTLNIYIHSRAALILMGELAEMGRLVMSEDATGELWDLPGTKLEGKIQHTVVTFQAT